MLINFTRVTAPAQKTNRAVAGFDPTLTGAAAKRQTALKYCLEEVAINPAMVLYLEPRTLEEERFPEGLNTEHKFTALVFSTGAKFYEAVVVGDLKTVASKLTQKQKVLKG